MLSIILIVICLFLVRGSTPVRAIGENSVSDIELGQARDIFQSQLGEPLKTSVRDGLQVFWYNSLDPLDADFIYTLNDQVIMKSFSVRKTKNQLEDYIGRYGFPEVNQRKFKDSVQDPFLFTVHIWVSKGVMVQTSGEQLSSSVMRIFQFAPTSLEAFYQTIAPDLSGNSRVDVNEEPINKALAVVVAQQESIKQAREIKVEPTQSEQATSPSLQSIEVVLPIAIVVVGVLSVLALIYALTRPSNSSTNSPPQT